MNKKYHYVYRITNTKLNKHYYGTRSSRIEPSKDLGFKYFSSSSDVLFMDDQKNNPQDYKYTIVSEFDSREEALELEVRLHAKFNVGVNESFYNKARQTSIYFDFDCTGMIVSEETKRKISEKAKLRKGRPVSEETRSKLSKAATGRIMSQEERDKMAKAISAALKGKPLPVATEPCKYCGKIMAKSHMTRWHGEKCKSVISTIKDLH
ncbi:NUMOD3 domain-containing DNA-binding protein [bacterium]|nr:NUMOD3 domain-containing DNA-binding protein [bacterium]